MEDATDGVEGRQTQNAITLMAASATCWIYIEMLVIDCNGSFQQIWK